MLWGDGGREDPEREKDPFREGRRRGARWKKGGKLLESRWRAGQIGGSSHVGVHSGNNSKKRTPLHLQHEGGGRVWRRPGRDSSKKKKDLGRDEKVEHRGPALPPPSADIATKIEGGREKGEGEFGGKSENTQGRKAGRNDTAGPKVIGIFRPP